MTLDTNFYKHHQTNENIQSLTGINWKSFNEVDKFSVKGILPPPNPWRFLDQFEFIGF